MAARTEIRLSAAGCFLSTWPRRDLNRWRLYIITCPFTLIAVMPRARLYIFQQEHVHTSISHHIANVRPQPLLAMTFDLQLTTTRRVKNGTLCGVELLIVRSWATSSNITDRRAATFEWHAFQRRGTHNNARIDVNINYYCRAGRISHYKSTRQ